MRKNSAENFNSLVYEEFGGKLCISITRYPQSSKQCKHCNTVLDET